MKIQRNISKAGIGLATLITIGIAPASHALTLAYETAGPWGPAGTGFASGPIEFVFNGVGTGTVYQPFGPAGTSVGNGALADVATMNALAGQLNSPNAIGGEDAFGVLHVVQIRDVNNNAVIWSPAGKNQQLVGTFFGGTDFWGRQDSVFGNQAQTTAITGFGINLYEQTPAAPNPNFSTITPADRGTGPGLEATTPTNRDFPLWTEDVNGGAAPNLALALSLKGVTGFLDPSIGGPVLPAGTVTNLRANTEVLSTFINSVGAQGNVQGFLEVTNPLLGSNAQINTNSFGALFNTAGGTVGGTFNTADARFTFTNQTLPFPTNPWLTSINGPAQTLVPIPEPSAVLSGIACMFPLLGSALTRRRKAKA